MKRDEILRLFKQKHIITENNKRKFCWKQKLDDEAKNVFNEFAKDYRTEEEAWFCLLKNVQPYHCEVCGQLATFTGSKKSKILGYNTVCDNCSANASKAKLKIFDETIKARTEEDRQQIFEKRKNTCLEKYGDENYTLYGSQKFKDTLKEKYGDENFNNREQAKKTCLERYGAACNLSMNREGRSQKMWDEQGDKIREKIKKTSLERYGYESPNQSPDVKQHQRDALIKRYGSIEEAWRVKFNHSKLTKKLKYGDENYHNAEQLSRTIEERHKRFEQDNNCTRYAKIYDEYGQGWLALKLPYMYDGRFRYISNEYIPIIKQYASENHNIASVSRLEKELYEFILSLTDKKIERNKRGIIKDKNGTYDLDIYIPELSLAFEFNGTYWHSTKFKDKYYHQNKTKLCYNNGIQLVHIWEYEWITDNKGIKRKITELLNGNDCSKYNWISVKDKDKYILTEPQEITLSSKYTIFNEGKFIPKQISI